MSPALRRGLIGLGLAVFSAVVLSVALPGSSEYSRGGRAVAEEARLSAVSFAAAAALPPSPVNATVASHTDTETIFAVPLAAGESFSARMRATSGSPRLALALYAPEAVSIVDHAAVVAGWELDIYPSYLVNDARGTFVAPRSGTYHLHVLELGGFGGYRVEWARGAQPTLSIATSKSTVSYGSSARVSGTLRSAAGTGVVGERVELWAAPYPAPYATTYVGSTVTTVGGAYAFTVSPNRKTRYRVVSMGSVGGFTIARSPSKTVQARVYLGRPAVSDSTKYRNRTFSAWGSLKPRHTPGNKSVRIKCYWRSGGRYKLVKTVSAVNEDYSTYTRYRAKLKLPYRGRWKLVAYAPKDGRHAATTSSSRYLTVR